MPLKIIGAGFGRTGTNSLKLALEQLGFGPCYHMYEVGQNPGHKAHWHAIAHGGAPDWDSLFAHYNSGIDWPIAGYWEALAGHYPEARIILTVRDPGEWFTSFTDTIATRLNTPLPDDATDEDRLHRAMLLKLIAQDTFGGRMTDRAYVIAVFEANIEKVTRTIPAEKLLIYDIAQGWGPLCDFLGAPVPTEAFPRTNSTRDFIDRNQPKK